MNFEYKSYAKNIIEQLNEGFEMIENSTIIDKLVDLCVLIRQEVYKQFPNQSINSERFFLVEEQEELINIVFETFKIKANDISLLEAMIVEAIESMVITKIVATLKTFYKKCEEKGMLRNKIIPTIENMLKLLNN